MSAHVSVMLVRPTTESRSANTFVRVVPDAPSFDKVGTLLAAECLLLLEAPASRGKLRSSEALIVASCSCEKCTFLDGRLIGVRSLSTSMQNLGS